MTDKESFQAIRVPRGDEWLDTTILDATLGKLVVNRELLEEMGLDVSLPAMIASSFSTHPKGARMLLERAVWITQWNEAKSQNPDAAPPIWRYPEHEL